MAVPEVIERDPSTDLYWVYAGLLIATSLHRGSHTLLTRYCSNFERYRLNALHFSDLSMKLARVVYFALVGIPFLSWMVSRMVSSPLAYPYNFFEDIDWWSGAALFTVAFDVYELGHFAHHVLELTITLLWLALEPSPMLIYAGSYVVVANIGFLFPVLMRLLPHTKTQQKVAATASVLIIMGSMLTTDALLLKHLVQHWNETPVFRRVSAVFFSIGFTTLDAMLCKSYFYPLIKKAHKGELYSPASRKDRAQDKSLNGAVPPVRTGWSFSYRSDPSKVNAEPAKQLKTGWSFIIHGNNSNRNVDNIDRNVDNINRNVENSAPIPERAYSMKPMGMIELIAGGDTFESEKYDGTSDMDTEKYEQPDEGSSPHFPTSQRSRRSVWSLRSQNIRTSAASRDDTGSFGDSISRDGAPPRFRSLSAMSSRGRTLSASLRSAPPNFALTDNERMMHGNTQSALVAL